VPPVYVGPEVVVETGARVGSLAVLGEGSFLGEGAVVESSVVGARAKVGGGSLVVGSILGDEVEVGNGCELRNLTVVGPGASLGAGNELDHGLRIGADQRIPEKALRFS
jgi:mannose-1-phosphate guanylyltransferase